jgi:hypothetical protein
MLFAGFRVFTHRGVLPKQTVLNPQGVMIVKRLVLGLATLALLLGAGSAKAGFTISHNGATDPAAEGFTIGSSGSSSSAGPLANDLGLPAWRITGSAQDSQFGYLSGALTASQQADVASQGFTLTLVARVVQGLAPAYDSTYHITIGAAHLDNGVRRFEIDLGLDSNGDTVAVLPTSIDAAGPGGSIQSPGPSYTLSGSGNGYHTYALHYNPATQLADLFVDGVDRIQGYAGHTSFVSNGGLVWAAFSGGEGHFNLVQLTSGAATAVPEAASLTLLGIGAVGLFGYRWRRRKGPGPHVIPESGRVSLGIEAKCSFRIAPQDLGSEGMEGALLHGFRGGLIILLRHVALSLAYRQQGGEQQVLEALGRVAGESIDEAPHRV